MQKKTNQLKPHVPHKEKKMFISPWRILVASYLFIITVGTILLYLPQSRMTKIPFIDLLLTSTSCTCVTGLMTVPMSYFTNFGKAVMLCLIQLGGIGLLTLSLFFISLFLDLGMATQMMAEEVFEFKWSKIKSFIITIVATTFIFELFGAIFFFFHFKKLLPIKEAIFHSIFHSVSAFCNTGLSIFENGLIPFKNNFSFLMVTAILIFMGSIGFIVWFEVLAKIKTFFKNLTQKQVNKTKFGLHTKIVLSTTLLIIAIGTTLTWFLERGNLFANSTALQGIFTSFFNTISLRSTGFELFDVSHLMPATILIFLILMYIGGSPGSIAGGIKTTTFAIFVATMATIVKNRDEVELFNRRIPRSQVYKAISVVFLTAAWILLISFILLITEKGFNFIQIFFEVISNFTLCGLKTKITASFSIFGKLLIISTMLVGRIGSLTLLFALSKRKKRYLYRYPEEQIVIG